MTESAGQFTTNKYSNEFEVAESRENVKTPAGNTVFQTSKFASEKNTQNKQIRNASFKPTSNTPSKSQPQKYFNSLTDKQKAEAYFDLYDQNLQLRAQKNEMDAQIKKLTTQLVRLTRDIKPVTNAELEAQNEELLKENKALRAKVNAKNQISRPNTAANVRRKPEIQTKIVEVVPENIENDMKEREDIIKLLKEQLEATEKELLRVQASSRIEFPDLSREYRDKAERLADVENKFTSLEEAMGAQKIYIQHLLSVLDDSQKALKDERYKTCELEVRIKGAEMAVGAAQELAYKLRNTENEKEQLEIRLKEVIEAYFELEAGRAENPVNFPSKGVEKLNL
jgi:hypothetical protein